MSSSTLGRPPGRSTPHWQRQRQQQRRQRRRRLLTACVAMAAIAILVVITVPLAKNAVNRDFGMPLCYAPIIRQQASAKQLDPALVAAVIYAETKCDPRTSPAGAEGLMQIEPSTALFLAKKSGATTFTTADLATPSVNIAYGSYYLRYLLNEFGQSKLLALAAYNGGAGNVTQWVARARAQGHPLTVNEIPFPETRAYVQRVLNAEGKYRSRYARQLGYG